MKCNLCQREINTKKERYVHIEDWEKNKNLYLKDKFQYKVRNQIIEQDLYYESLSFLNIG